MVSFTDEEKEFLHAMVESELRSFESSEAEIGKLITNSPFLSQLALRNKDIHFLATEERYHEFLLKLKSKLK